MLISLGRLCTGSSLVPTDHGSNERFSGLCFGTPIYCIVVQMSQSNYEIVQWTGHYLRVIKLPTWGVEHKGRIIPLVINLHLSAGGTGLCALLISNFMEGSEVG